jgi:hypothetical protein
VVVLWQRRIEICLRELKKPWLVLGLCLASWRREGNRIEVRRVRLLGNEHADSSVRIKQDQYGERTMRFLPILILAGVSLSLSAQTASTSAAGNAAGSANPSHATAQAGGSATGQAATQAGNAGASFAQSSNVSAQLTKKIDTKNAKVGDEVLAKTTSNAQLTDGTKVPKGTKLVGEVTEVQPKSGAEKSSHLAFAMNKAILRDGREVPMHAMLTSVAPPMAMASGNTADDLSAGAGPIGGGGDVSGGGRAAAGGGGGLLGGAGRATGGVVGSAGNTLGNTASGVGSATGSTLRTTEGVGANGLGAVANAGSSTAGQLDHVAVPNMPGVTLSSAANSSSSGALDAAGKNISLDSGTQMTMQVSAR